MDYWELAQGKKDILQFSTLFTARCVQHRLATGDGIDGAIRWCRETAVTKVYLESFRSGHLVERELLLRAKERFLAAGFEVAGCVTTTGVGKISTGWKITCCFTDNATLDRLESIFAYTASMFDAIMIDDFLFTECKCEECRRAKGSQTWASHRCEQMSRLSRERIIKPAKNANPNAKVIIKYPQWYDGFHLRGYDVVRETEDFDQIWVGTESRDPDSRKWGRKAQYESYFIMRWLREIGGAKTGGGWFDSIGTSPPVFVEQARQTILGGARELFLFAYGGFFRHKGPDCIERLRDELPELYRLAALVKGKALSGVSAVKPPNSSPGKEKYIFDYLGMLGLPLEPAAAINFHAPSCFFSYHALAAPDFKDLLSRMIKGGKPVLITDGLAARLRKMQLNAPNAIILPVQGDPRSIMDLPPDALSRIRAPLLEPFGISLDAPSRVSFYLFGEDLMVFENFNDYEAEIKLSGPGYMTARAELAVPKETAVTVKTESPGLKLNLPARALAVFRKV
ncbi:MAG: hypothetical protein ACM3WV_05930 [Bacillota bacterium]